MKLLTDNIKTSIFLGMVIFSIGVMADSKFNCPTINEDVKIFAIIAVIVSAIDYMTRVVTSKKF